MSSGKFTIIANSNPTKAKVTLKETENGVTSTVTLDSGDVITAILYKNDAALSTEVTVNMAADGTDLANGTVVPEWTQVESVTWDRGDADLWITRNGVTWLPAKVKIIRGPG